ncbi:MAG: HEAT repeat domain-containing protein [Planctomycetaceae bacterium]
MLRIESARGVAAELILRTIGRSPFEWATVRLSVVALQLCCGLIASLPCPALAEDSLTDVPVPETTPQTLPWHRSLAPAIEESRQRNVSILVRVGADWCGWCRKLDKEIADPRVQQELARWILVELDADKDAADIRRMSVGPIPALRVLNVSGRVMKAHDGFLPASEFVAWLRSPDDLDEPELSDVVTEVPELSQETLPQLVQMLGHRDANVRAAVIRQLSTNQGLAGAAVVQEFMRGNLAKRLSALDILNSWKAPTGDSDPWQPATLTAARFNELEEWVDQLDPTAELSDDQAVVPLTPEQLIEARADIAKLVTVDPSEVEAIGVHLARYGSELLPEVREQQRVAMSDKIRERLDWLRYRLVASDALVLKWPGGLTRLAATESQIRRNAASELSTVATSGEELLLIELFANPDPFVREMSLKALQGVGGARANTELMRLLSDPEPNVRAAVLKQLSEQPDAISVKQIADYIATEQDQDLVVHAVRLLREIKRKEVIDCLTPLFKHSAWQIRAEAVEAVGALVSDIEDTPITTQDAAEAYTNIIDALSDSDGYVVSRAVLALKAGDLPIAAPPLAKAAERHPELAMSVADSLTHGSTIRTTSKPLLRAWLKLDNAALRVAALRALGEHSDLDGKRDLLPALSDDSESVRIAAARHVLRMCDERRPSVEDGQNLVPEEPVASSVLESVLGALGVTTDKQPVVETPEVKDPSTEDPEKKNDVAEVGGAHEVWLIAFLSGKGRPKWMDLAKEPLQAMLKSVSAEERLAGAAALIALGEDQIALPELQRIASEQRHLVPAVAQSMRWLPWKQRAEFFAQLHSPDIDQHTLATLCKELVVMRDSRASSLLWDELAGERVTSELSQAVLSDLQHNYGMVVNLYGFPDVPRKPVGFKLGDVKQYATSQHLWQQRVALALLLLVDETAAAEVAQSIVANDQAAPASRVDAFCIVLLTSSSRLSNRSAVAALVDLESPLRRPALAYLALGVAGVQSLADGEFELPRVIGSWSQLSRQAKKPPLPKELTAQHLRPFMSSSDDVIVAQAAYLLAMLGESDGMDQLITHWRRSRQSNDSQKWEELVVEAIAASDNSKYVPVIEEVYRAMKDDRSHEVRDLYWTIRTMHGPEILRLRKKIRDEQGMDNLR